MADRFVEQGADYFLQQPQAKLQIDDEVDLAALPGPKGPAPGQRGGGGSQHNNGNK